jgi:hypothetical protein
MAGHLAPRPIALRPQRFTAPTLEGLTPFARAFVPGKPVRGPLKIDAVRNTGMAGVIHHPAVAATPAVDLAQRGVRDNLPVAISARQYDDGVAPRDAVEDALGLSARPEMPAQYVGRGAHRHSRLGDYAAYAAQVGRDIASFVTEPLAALAGAIRANWAPTAHADLCFARAQRFEALALAAERVDMAEVAERYFTHAMEAYDETLAGYQAVASVTSMLVFIQRADLVGHLGDYAQALGDLTLARTMVPLTDNTHYLPPVFRAYLTERLGDLALQRGDRDKAAKRYAVARAFMPAIRIASRLDLHRAPELGALMVRHDYLRHLADPEVRDMWLLTMEARLDAKVAMFQG